MTLREKLAALAAKWEKHAETYGDLACVDLHVGGTIRAEEEHARELRAALAAPDEGRRDATILRLAELAVRSAAEEAGRQAGPQIGEESLGAGLGGLKTLRHFMEGLAAPASPEPEPALPLGEVLAELRRAGRQSYMTTVLHADSARDQIDADKALSSAAFRYVEAATRAASPEPKDRARGVIKRARSIVADWTSYCRRRGSAHYQNGKAFLCTGCAYDAVAQALEAPAASPDPEPARCNAEHPIFTYTCFLVPGHTGPHDNGSGDPWETP